ncbi:MAG: c-type cytochrome [Pseudomonadota bacterium]
MKFSAAIATVLVVVAGWVYALPPGTNDEISARLEPFGVVCRSGDDCGASTAAASSGPLSGQQVYDQFCFACHASGVGGAPLLGDTAGWGDRVDKGMDALMDSTINGINAMPAKGTCMNCSDDELGLAVQYMLDQL